MQVSVCMCVRVWGGPASCIWKSSQAGCEWEGEAWPGLSARLGPQPVLALREVIKFKRMFLSKVQFFKNV